jgi:hypothetical protein
LPIKTVLSEAQNGQAYANLARAFHLPPAKVEHAVDAMLDALITDIGERMASRRSLSAIVELLGRSEFERVLETPAQLGATHTQVLGNEALNVIAGRNESKRLVRRAATAADVSERITEYLLPVIAAMLVGALTKMCHPELEDIMGHVRGDGAAAGDTDPNVSSLELPRVAGGVGFSGSTGGTVGVAGSAASASHYIKLAEEIRRAGAGGPDPAEAVRLALAPNLGLSRGARGWIRRLGLWSTGALNAALAGLRR